MMTDITMHVTFIILCVFNLCFGFAWKGDLINHINTHRDEMESNESPHLYWRRKKVPDNTRHLSFMVNNQKLKRLVYPKRFFQYSPYFIKNKLQGNQKLSSPVFKEIINSKKHLESNSLADLRHISDREIMDEALHSNLPPSIPHISNPNKDSFEISEKFDENTFGDPSESSKNEFENEDRGLLLPVQSNVNGDQYNDGFYNADKFINMDSTGDKSESQAGISTGPLDPFLSRNTGFTNYGNENSMEHGNYDSWFTDEKSKSHNEEKILSFPERLNSGEKNSREIMGKSTFPVVDKYNVDFGSSRQSLPDSFGTFNDNGFTDNGWNDGFDSNFDFETDPQGVPGGFFSPSISEGHFVSDNTHCDDIETRTCRTNMECQCYGLFYCDKGDAKCKKYGSSVPDRLSGSSGFPELPEVESDWSGWLDR